MSDPTFCQGCGSMWDDAELARQRAANPRMVSCCPERKMSPAPPWPPEEVVTLLDALARSADQNQTSYSEVAHIARHAASTIRILLLELSAGALQPNVKDGR